MKVTIQKTMNVQDPVRAHDTDAGLDLYVPEGQGCLVRPGAVYTINLGVNVAIPDGYYGQLTLRSSAGQAGLVIPHGVGVIDSGYRGNIKLLVTALAEPVHVATGERVCQLIVLPRPPIDVEIGVVDDSTERSTGGFGSTGIRAMVRAHGDAQGHDSLTIGQLMGQLREIASRHGDIPVVIPSAADADYEQATAPIVMHADRETVPGDWDLFHIDPAGTPVAVIS